MEEWRSAVGGKNVSNMFNIGYGTLTATVVNEGLGWDPRT